MLDLGVLNKSPTEINLIVSIAIMLHMAAHETLLVLRLNQWLVVEVTILSGTVCWQPRIPMVMVQVMAKNSAITMEMANQLMGLISPILVIQKVNPQNRYWCRRRLSCQG